MAMDGGKAILPQDIIIDILKRLPVKSLIRFRSVCKDWKNLFNSPSFIADHLHHSDHKNPFLLLQGFHPRHDYLRSCLLDCKMEVLELPHTPLIDSFSHVRILGSSNGLLCVELCQFTDDVISSHSLLLWNPAIKEVRQLPIPTNDFRGFWYLGFGFSPIVNDFKIVGIYIPDENWKLILNKTSRIGIYSLCTGSWKEVEFGTLQSVCLQYHTVVANGAMFWLGLKTHVGDEDDRYLVVSFDISMEVFTLIPMPASASKSYENRLTVYESKLAMLSNFVIGNESCLIDLWVMEKGTGASGESWSWTKKYTVGPFSGVFHPLSIWRNEILATVGETECLKTVLSLINPTTNELKKFPNRRYEYYHVCDVFNYAESLVPVGNIHIEKP